MDNIVSDIKVPPYIHTYETRLYKNDVRLQKKIELCIVHSKGHFTCL